MGVRSESARLEAVVNGTSPHTALFISFAFFAVCFSSIPTARSSQVLQIVGLMPCTAKQSNLLPAWLRHRLQQMKLDCFTVFRSPVEAKVWEEENQSRSSPCPKSLTFWGQGEKEKKMSTFQ